MKLADLRDVCAEALIMIEMQISVLRRGHCETPEEEVWCKLLLADLTLLRAELNDHIGALQSILTVCTAVTTGRYLQDWQQCTRWAGQCEGCTSAEACDSFDDREPYTVIDAYLSELSPLSDFARRWILFQEPYQRQRRAMMFGPEGLFGGRKVVMYQDNGSGGLKPMSDEDAVAAMAARNALTDAKNASMALRLDQYALNLERLRYLCTVKGDLQEMAAIIETGMPPQVRSTMVPS
jgi:hypothetical protein